jgi:hypothetical protein
LEEDFMRGHTFDVFTRRATVAVTRRGSLLALGGAAFATGLGSSTGLAAKDSKDKRNKRKARKARKNFQNELDEQKALCQSIVLATLPEASICCNSGFSGDFMACLVAFTP